MYTIPLVDLNTARYRQTVVDYEKGIYLGHPTTALLDDGKTILCVYPQGHGMGRIIYKKSFDGGRTWTDRLPTPESWDTSLEVPTIYRTKDADGKKHLILFTGLRPIRMAHSEDEGETWSELEPIFPQGGIVAMADIEEVGKGKYIAVFHDDGRFFPDAPPSMKRVVWRTGKGPNARTRQFGVAFDDQGNEGEPWPVGMPVPDREGDAWEKIYEAAEAKPDDKMIVYQTESDDGGLHWTAPHAIAYKEDAGLCEPCLIRSPDGKTLCMLLRENYRNYNSFYCLSTDNGATWSEPKELTASLTGDRHAAVYLPDGNLFVSFRDTLKGSPTWGDWVGWIGKFEDIPEGKEGLCRIRLCDNLNGADCAYPALQVLPDGTVVATTYGHWTEDEPAYILSVRFKAEEIYEKIR